MELHFDLDPPLSYEVEFMPRSVVNAVNYWMSLPRELVPVPWGERLRRCRRDWSLHHLRRSHDVRIVYPTGGKYGIRLTQYVPGGVE